MKKAVIIISSVIVVFIILILIYINLPFQIKYKTEIKFGNQLIENIEKFRIENDSIPNSNDWQILKSFGFDVEIDSFLPIYEKINQSDYILLYCWGFDPPWLFYYSKTKEWKYGFNIPHNNQTNM